MEGIFDTILSLAGSFVAIFALIPFAIKFPLTIFLSVILSIYIYFNKRVGKIIVKSYLILLLIIIIIRIYAGSSPERILLYSDDPFLNILKTYDYVYLLFGLVLFLVIANMADIVEKIKSWMKK